MTRPGPPRCWRARGPPGARGALRASSTGAGDPSEGRRGGGGRDNRREGAPWRSPDESLELAGPQTCSSLEHFKGDHELKFEEPIYLQGFSICKAPGRTQRRRGLSPIRVGVLTVPWLSIFLCPCLERYRMPSRLGFNLIK